jgi:hypothetical protein
VGADQGGSAGAGVAQGKLTRSYLLVEVTHSKPIPNLTDVVAGRIWSVDGVRESSARAISQDAGWAAIQHDRDMGHG